MVDSPAYRAAWSGESIALQSGDSALHLYRRTTGWGWGELTDRDGNRLAVLDHFGEVAVHGVSVPMRLEAAQIEETESGIRCHVRSMDIRAALHGSSFEQWVGIPLVGPIIEGDVTISVDGNGGYEFTWTLTSCADVGIDYLRGPWLTVGRTSFGSERDDAILPGIEWAQGKEWTSGDDWFRDPWGMRATPPIDSVGMPIMAVSQGGRSVSLSWDAPTEVTGWFNARRERAQPVFASPNFIERNDSSLLGIMIPEARTGGDEWHAKDPLELHRGQRITMQARIAVGQGSGLDAITSYVARTGLPKSAPFDVEEEVHAIARTYGSTLWKGTRFGVGQKDDDITATVPPFVHRYIERFPKRAEAARLRECVATLAVSTSDTDILVARAEMLLTVQRPDGSFTFDPSGRHASKDDFVVARDLVAPMGVAGDSALDLDVLPALDFLRAFDATGDEKFVTGARRALDAARTHRRPEGGDFWETPIHAPNLLAAGHAAVAYASAWQRWGDERDRLAARHWLRSMLVFTHLWDPHDRPMIYNTKPCLCSSDWYFANWVRDHVQWEVIESFALMTEFAIDPAAIDETVDWATYAQGIAGAGVRWLIDHRLNDWRPHNLPDTLSLYEAGEFDGCLPDTHNSTTGLYGGMAIPPGRLGQVLLGMLDRGAPPVVP